MSKLEEIIDKTFHHAQLVSSDDEWNNIKEISNCQPYIFVGNFENSLIPMPGVPAPKNKKYEVFEKKIKVILSIMPSDKAPAVLQNYKTQKILHMHVPLDNVAPEHQPPGTLSFQDACDKGYNIIASAVTQKLNILIHCTQGVSVAPFILCYYNLRTFYILKPNSSSNILPILIEKIKKARPCIAMHYSFLEFLEDTEAKLSGRPVKAHESLSIRRNPAIMKALTTSLKTDVEKELQTLKQLGSRYDAD